MNDMRDYYLKHLGVGEIWQLRQPDLSATDPAFALTEFTAHGQADGTSDIDIPEVLAPATTPTYTQIEREVRGDVEPPADWPTLQRSLQQCQACSFCAKFGKGMLGSGDVSASVLAIADWVSPDNTLQLDPVLQQTEKLMSNILAALPSSDNQIGASSTKLTVYRTSLLKAQISDILQLPMDAASSDVVSACLHFLHQQIKLVKPQVILVFGEHLARRLLGAEANSENKMRQAQLLYRDIPVIVTHDAHILLKHPEAKYEVWQDLCRLMQL